MSTKPSFEAGIAFTLAELVRMAHIGATEVKNLLDGIGHDLPSLLQAGADDEDIATLRKEMGE